MNSKEARPLRWWDWPSVWSARICRLQWARLDQCVNDLEKRCRRKMRKGAHITYESNHLCLDCYSNLPRSQQEYSYGAGECKHQDVNSEDGEYKWTCIGCVRIKADWNVQLRSGGGYRENPETVAEPSQRNCAQFRGMQITRMTGHTAGCLILPNNAVHEELKDQVMHTHVEDENLQPRTLMVIP